VLVSVRRGPEPGRASPRTAQRGSVGLAAPARPTALLDAVRRTRVAPEQEPWATCLPTLAETRKPTGDRSNASAGLLRGRWIVAVLTVVLGTLEGPVFGTSACPGFGGFGGLPDDHRQGGELVGVARELDALTMCIVGHIALRQSDAETSVSRVYPCPGHDGVSRVARSGLGRLMGGVASSRRRSPVTVTRPGRRSCTFPLPSLGLGPAEVPLARVVQALSAVSSGLSKRTVPGRSSRTVTATCAPTPPYGSSPSLARTMLDPGVKVRPARP
jgi:hypothetical protein